MNKLFLFLMLFSPALSYGSQIILSTVMLPTAAQDSSAGIPVWVDPTNVEIEDNIVSTDSVGTGSYLESTAYGFNIPANSTILGIQAEVKKRQTTSGMVDQSVLLIKPNGDYTVVEHASASAWPSLLTWVSYGSNSDRWGRNWTPSDINSSGFGFAIQAGNTGIAQIDAIRLTIYYIPNANIISSGVIKSGILR